MSEQLHFYNISMKYVRDLANQDDNVLSVSPQTGKKDRPFIGILVMLNGKQYCAPLSSPKPKHNTMAASFDFLKITEKVGGQEKIIGVINFNNMIPVHSSVIDQIKLKVAPTDTPQIRNKKVLMSKQLNWCRSHSDLIIKNAQKTYDMVTNRSGNKKLIRRCCNFQKLENILEKRLARLRQMSAAPKQTKSFAQGLDDFAKRVKGQSSTKPHVHNGSDRKRHK